jgi:hypothetical protein
VQADRIARSLYNYESYEEAYYQMEKLLERIGLWCYGYFDACGCKKCQVRERVEMLLMKNYYGRLLEYLFNDTINVG